MLPCGCKDEDMMRYCITSHAQLYENHVFECIHNLQRVSILQIICSYECNEHWHT